ncbi:MAG: hypothetical protein Ta2F_04780 [Termitinemataceae bacterium]|nr:MAG: hypothetical protein Ta2F_04780 [Termitinemataceae bacterium]
MIQLLHDMFSFSFLVRAFLVGLSVSLCASLLGVSLVLKRYSMIGDGLSHVGFGALAAAAALHLNPLAAALPLVLTASFVLLRLNESSKIKGDAAIAMISTGSLAAGVIIIANTKGMNIDISNYLFGSILTTSTIDAYISVGLSIVVLILFVAFYNNIFAVTFDETFARACGVNTNIHNMVIAFLTALTIVLGLRMMGAMLISSLTIFPALTAMRVCKRFKTVTVCSAIISVVCYFFGLIISFILEMPTGAAVVVLNILAFFIFWVINMIKQNEFFSARKKVIPVLILVTVTLLTFSSCRKSLGWGVLLWASEDSGIPSGTVVKVQIKSNINKVWIVRIPKEYRMAGENYKKNVEIPLAQLELLGSKRDAVKRSKEFGEYALVYAETLQDGLPVREAADNGARRVYRLRVGEVVKILKPIDGNPAISATGAPLPGQWFRILTEDGTEGCCFSYRLRLFDHTVGEISSVPAVVEEVHDKELDSILSTTWVAQMYGDMINENKLDIYALSKHWGFSIGEDTGIANIFLPDADQSFKYSRITPEGGKTWHFEGTTLRMHLRSPSILSVSYIDDSAINTNGMSGAQRQLLFISIPSTLDDLVMQEETRRDQAYQEILIEGPTFESEYYGKIYFTEETDILWEGFDLLIPSILPVSILGRGKAVIKYFLSEELQNEYKGVITFNLKAIGGSDQSFNFLYALDDGDGIGGLRMEYVPDWCIEDITVAIRDISPTVMYFYQIKVE